MSHNKMYREIEGYEDALYLTTDIMDDLEELNWQISNGSSKGIIKSRVDLAIKKLDEIKSMMNEP